MVPEEFKQRIIHQKSIDAEELLKALEEPSPVSIRINSSKWHKRPQNSDPVPWCTTAYYLDSRPSYTLDPLFHSGCYYPQEASGMFLEQAILQAAGSLEKIRVLDLCGAPGGKSTLISGLLGSDSFLVANEVIRSRAVILAETITKWGTGNTLVTQNDPEVIGRLSGYFDLILTDAPCSGEGMFRTNIAINEWSAENAAHCSERQKRILMDVWPALKENGILIYSTCTFNPGENEENIKWLTEKLDAESVRLNVSEFKGISEIDYQGTYGYGFYPDKVRGDGFFISVIRKRSKQVIDSVSGHRFSDQKPFNAHLEVANEWTHFSKERILKWEDEIFAVSCSIDDYIHLFQHLRIVKAGTKIFMIKKKDYLPFHELALSQKMKKDAFPRMEIDLSQAISFLRRDSINLQNLLKGWNILTYKGVNLGYVNNIGKRFNNYFPVDWRIRMNKPAEGFENIIQWNSDDSIIT